MMDDLISRQAVLDKAEYWIAMQETKTGFIEKRGYFVDADNIKTLPSVQPEQKWVPVSEGLPEENEEVLVTFKSDDEIRVYNCKYFDNSPWWKNYVIAWMPLPEPYKAESEDE